MDIKGFLEHYSGLREQTLRAYGATLVMLERYIKGVEPIEDEVRFFLHGFKLGTTIQRHKAAIRKYFLYKHLPWDFDSREFTAPSRRLPEYLTKEEVDKLMETAQGDEKIFVELLFVTGLRVGELMSLTIDNIEPDGIRVVGKGGKERFIPIVDDGVMTRLINYANQCSGRLFPLKYYEYVRLLRRLCRFSGVKEVTPHKLRHSTAVYLISKGVPLSAVQALLGHVNPSTTLIYTALTQQDLRKELEKAGRR